MNTYYFILWEMLKKTSPSEISAANALKTMVSFCSSGVLKTPCCANNLLVLWLLLAILSMMSSEISMELLKGTNMGVAQVEFQALLLSRSCVLYR